MIYGIEQSTDMRDPRTKVIRTRSLGGAREWANLSGGFTYADPEGARNFHHTYRSLWETVPGNRIPSAAALRKAAREKSTRDYPRTDADELAAWIRRECREIESAESRPSPAKGERGAS